MCKIEKRKLDSKTTSLVKGNAIKYMRYKDSFNTIPPEELDLFRREVEEAYLRVQRAVMFLGACEGNAPNGIHEHKFVQFVDYDPYPDLNALSRHVQEEQTLYVSTLNNDSKLLPGELNLKFRAVHDYLHYFLQQPFDFLGEYKVYQAQKHLHKSKLRRQILYSEVVLQAAYCEYFGKFADKQKIVL